MGLSVLAVDLVTQAVEDDGAVANRVVDQRLADLREEFLVLEPSRFKVDRAV